MFNRGKTRRTDALQSNKMIGLMIMLTLSLVFLSSIDQVSAVPPFQTAETSSNSLQIESPNLPVTKIGQQKRFHAHVVNATKLKTNITTSCALHVYNTTGWDVDTKTQWMEFEAYNGIDFAMSVSGGNFSKAGIYAYVIQCNSTNEVGFYRGQFAVTPNGEIADTGTAVFYIGLLGILLFFLAVTIFSFAYFDNLLNRVGMIGIGYLLIMAITFIGWHMSEDFLTSSPFLIDMLRILFMVFAIGFFPLVLGAFAWYFLQLWKIKEIQDMMEHGMDEHEAHRRMKGR